MFPELDINKINIQINTVQFPISNLIAQLKAYAPTTMQRKL